MRTLQDVQKFNQQLWGPQPATRERLIKRLEEHCIGLVGEDYVTLHEIAAQMVAWDLKFSGTMPPEVMAHNLGHKDWMAHITWVLKRIGTRAGGRPRNDDDARLLLRLVEDSLNHPSWKAIACEFEKQTGKAMNSEACRSAVRRYRATRTQ